MTVSLKNSSLFDQTDASGYQACQSANLRVQSGAPSFGRAGSSFGCYDDGNTDKQSINMKSLDNYQESF